MKRILKLCYAYFAVFVGWYLLYVLVRSPIVPPPAAAIVNFFQIFPSKLWLNLLVSTFRILISLTVALLAGTAIGVFSASCGRLDEIISPIVYLLYPVPKIAFLPVLMVFFGLGDLPKVVLIVIIIVFQFILSTRDAVKKIPRELTVFAQSLNLSRRNHFLHFTLPAILPAVFTSLRINIGIGIAVLFFAENFATKYGIGYFIMNNWVMANYLDMYGGILGVSLLGMVLFAVVDGVERRVCRYRL